MSCPCQGNAIRLSRYVIEDTNVPRLRWIPLPYGMRDQPQDTEERSARQRARSGLEQREVERSSSRLEHMERVG
jgi:hypothetical protein